MPVFLVEGIEIWYHFYSSMSFFYIRGDLDFTMTDSLISRNAFDFAIVNNQGPFIAPGYDYNGDQV